MGIIMDILLVKNSVVWLKKFSTRYSTLIKDVRTYLMKGWLQGVREILNWNTFSNKLCDKNKIKQDCQNWRNSVKICVNVHTSCVLLIPFFSVYQPFSFFTKSNDHSFFVSTSSLIHFVDCDSFVSNIFLHKFSSQLQNFWK